jgi:hypothetical protein
MSERLPLVAVLHGPNAAASTREIVAASSGLCELLFVFRSVDVLSHPEQVQFASRISRVAVTDSTTFEDVGGGDRFDGVTTFLDREVEALDELQRKPQLNSSSAWDKLNQRTLLAHSGVDVTQAIAVDSVPDFLAAVESIGFPGVLKMRRGVSGKGLRFVRSIDDVTRETALRPSWRNLIYEEYLARGRHPSHVEWLEDYVSVETVSTEKERIHTAVFDKFPLSVVEEPGSDRDHVVRESGEIYPSRLPAPVMSDVLKFCDRVLDVLDVHWRVTHTELRVSERGIRLIEVNGRPGGDVTQLGQDLTGVNIVRIALQLALRQEPSVSLVRPTGFGACIDLGFPYRSGRVRSNVSRTLLSRLPNVTKLVQLAKYGDLRSATAYRAACVFVEAGNLAQLDDTVISVTAAIVDAFHADDLAREPLAIALRGSRPTLE